MSDARGQIGRMLVLTRVVALGSFAAAGREIGISKSLVSGAVSELERELGVRLLERTTRKLALTQAGERFYARANEAMNEAALALREATDMSDEPTGTLRVTCTSALVDVLVAPVIAALTARTALRADIIVDDRRRDLVAEGLDAGVRIGAPRESGFSVRLLAGTKELIVAAPPLVQDIDRNDFEAVSRLPWIAHRELPPSFRLLDKRGHPKTLRVDPTVSTGTGTGQRALLLAGAGASVAIAPLVQRDVEAGKLVVLLSNMRTPESKIFAIFPSNKSLPKRTRAFLDALAEHAKTIPR